MLSGPGLPGPDLENGKGSETAPKVAKNGVVQGVNVI